MPQYSPTAREEQLKNQLRQDYFRDYDATPILGNIDFAVAVPTDGQQLFETEYLLWAEAKEGTKHDIGESFVQLILTIGKARTFDRHLPPAFLGAYDAEKIAFLPYNAVMDVFYQNDFNWNVTPSDHQTKEFRQLLDLIKGTLNGQAMLFRYAADDAELRHFIRQNFVAGKRGLSKVRINKNNFTHVYQKWLAEVKPSIAIDWAVAKQEGLIEADFYLADILSEHNVSLKEKLFVLLRSDHYVYNIRRKATGALSFDAVDFNDGQQAHTRFWARYDRPPRRDYWDYIVARRDLLVPQNIRERKGSFFTPHRWVELSQDYIARELGDDWQDEYTVWDCCAGTGNLLNGLTNKWNVWASTLDHQDVKAMQDLVAADRLNLLDSHVFQFDFLNDSFDKLPQPLQDIIADPERRKRLLIYINPPYAEAGNSKAKTGNGNPKTNVAVSNRTYKIFLDRIGLAGRELYAQFFIRIYEEIPGSMLAEFSKLKILQASNFELFRKVFKAELKSLFIVPANTFDNVRGEFPIGFFVWNTDSIAPFTSIDSDVYSRNGEFIGKKTISTVLKGQRINDWIIKSRQFVHTMNIGFLSYGRNDFQSQNAVYILNKKEQMPVPRGIWITDGNLAEICIYFAVYKTVPATWLNDRDQFLFPDDGWQADYEFQSDCLVYTLFNNNIQSKYGANHWIPFTEAEVDAKEKFKSHFMVEYMERGHSCPRTSSAATTGMSLLHTPQQGDLFEEAATSPDTTTGMSLPHTGDIMKYMERGHSCPRPAHTQQQDLFAATTPGMSLLHTDDVGAATLLSPTNYNDAIASFDQSCAVEDAGRQECRPSHDEDKNVLAPYVPREHFSEEAKAVMDAGRELWRYYHAQPNANPDASFYDIRLHFQGTKVTASGKTQMNPDSADVHYTSLVAELRKRLKALARKIEPKVYEYGFLNH